MSLREFAKRKRANSWQSTEKFCGVTWGFWGFWGGILLNLSVVEFFGVWLGFFGVLAEVLWEFLELVA